MNKIKTIGLIAMFLLSTTALFAQAKKKANKDTKKWRYEIECVSTGAQGTYLIKVWSYSKNPGVAMNQAKKNAVHGVVFKGFSGAGAGCTQKSLTSNPSIEEQHAEFFDQFFADGGKYMKYVTVSNDGAISAEDRIKVGKEYKIGVIVSVQKDLLRKDLEAAGIIKGMMDGF